LPEGFEDYLRTAGEQIRWKRARPALLSELRTHLLDQQDACLREGLSQEAAQEEALRQMGDPVTVGQGLDSVHRPKPQWGLLALILALVVIGAALRVNLSEGWISEVSLTRTILSLLLGSGALLGCYFLDYTFLGRRGKVLYLAVLAAGILLLLREPLPTTQTYYASQMIYLFPLIYGAWIYSWRGAGWLGYLLSLLGFVPLLLITSHAVYVAESLILAVVGAVLLAILVWKDWYGVGKGPARGVFLTGCGFLVILAGTAVFSSAYYWKRLEIALHPETDPLGAGYGAMTVRAALEGAQWTGPGVWAHGASYEESMPGRFSDYLLTTLIHKLGWLPFLLLMLAFLGLIAWVLFKCVRQKNTLARVVVLAVVLPILLRGLCAAAMNLSFILFSVSFPLLSGNMVMIADMALLGFALSVFRQEGLTYDRPPAKPAKKLRVTISWTE